MIARTGVKARARACPHTSTTQSARRGIMPASSTPIVSQCRLQMNMAPTFLQQVCKQLLVALLLEAHRRMNMQRACDHVGCHLAVVDDVRQRHTLKIFFLTTKKLHTFPYLLLMGLVLFLIDSLP